MTSPALDRELRSDASDPIGLDGIEVNGADVTGVTEAIEGLKKESPEWFGGRKAPDATPDPTTPVDFRSATDEELQAELAKYGRHIRT